MNTVYFLLGSNLENRAGMLERARVEVTNKIGRIIGKSSIYESEPWGFQAENSFLNQVIIVETGLNAVLVLAEILKVENQLGRKRINGSRYSSRVIDIDILFFNDEIIRQDDLIIPHPGIPERMFTLIPLSEIDRTLVHPDNGKTIGALLEACTDKSKVYPYHQD